MKGSAGMSVLEEYGITKKYYGIEYKYFYRLLQNQYNGYSAYGIEIEKKEYIGMTKIDEYKDSIKLVSTQRHEVKTLLMNLQKNIVSPIHLIDIVGEFVDEHVYEFDFGMVREA